MIRRDVTTVSIIASGTSLPVVATIVLTVLKLLNLITWGWVIVLMPMIIELAVCFLLAITVLLAIVLSWLAERF